MEWKMGNLPLDYADSDFVVEVKTSFGEGFVIPAHGFVLRRVSKVFATMLEPGRFKEGISKKILLTIQGDQDDAITFMRYLYTKEVKELSLTSYVSLMKTAHMYEVTDLFSLCEKKILPLLTPINVCKVYSMLELLKSQKIKAACVEMMEEAAFLIFMNDLHLPLSEDTMQLLIKSDNLNVLNEEQVLIAIWQWLNHTSCAFLPNNQKERNIDNLLALVRWSLIKKTNRSNDAPWRELLEKNITESDAEAHDREARKTVSLFQFARNLKIIFNGIPTEQTPLPASQKHLLIKFSSDQDILLRGFTMHICHFQEYYYTRLPFDMYVNRILVTDLVYDNLIVSHLVVNSLDMYSKRMKMELGKPLLLKKSCINRVEIDVKIEHFSAPSYLVRTSPKRITSATDNTVRFYFDGQATGIVKLYYFLMK